MNTKITPKDFFLHLGATAVLYVGAVALIDLSFSIINYHLPDVLAGGYYTSSSIAWPVSMLIILVPILYVLEWFIGRDVARVPEKREIWVRRWRISLTLFLTGATIAGDLIYLINTYLNGEISSRLVYKVLAVLAVSAVVFAYYLFARISDPVLAKTWQTILAWLGIIIVLSGIVGGFMVVGTPAKQRALRFDSERVNDLSNIQGRIIAYWMDKRQLPAAFSDLIDPLSNIAVPDDPETKEAYSYSVKGATLFELCANFALPTEDVKGRGAYDSYGGYGAYPAISGGYYGDTNDSWQHNAGRVCFERTIDPERYPPKPPVKL
ncbi:MAG: hypothetical protein QOG91_334 [Candidatus Parcubacteria bacterium]|jgi:hypothetical protein|nr:hypothetical protein [Candidatus Parcubacteria bacterium]